MSKSGYLHPRKIINNNYVVVESYPYKDKVENELNIVGKLEKNVDSLSNRLANILLTMSARERQNEIELINSFINTLDNSALANSLRKNLYELERSNEVGKYSKMISLIQAYRSDFLTAADNFKDSYAQAYKEYWANSVNVVWFDVMEKHLYLLGSDSNHATLADCINAAGSELAREDGRDLEFTNKVTDIIKGKMKYKELLFESDKNAFAQNEDISKKDKAWKKAILTYLDKKNNYNGNEWKPKDYKVSVLGKERSGVSLENHFEEYFNNNMNLLTDKNVTINIAKLVANAIIKDAVNGLPSEISTVIGKSGTRTSAWTGNIMNSKSNTFIESDTIGITMSVKNPYNQKDLYEAMEHSADNLELDKLLKQTAQQLEEGENLFVWHTSAKDASIAMSGKNSDVTSKIKEGTKTLEERFNQFKQLESIDLNTLNDALFILINTGKRMMFEGLETSDSVKEIIAALTTSLMFEYMEDNYTNQLGRNKLKHIHLYFLTGYWYTASEIFEAIAKNIADTSSKLKYISGGKLTPPTNVYYQSKDSIEASDEVKNLSGEEKWIYVRDRALQSGRFGQIDLKVLQFANLIYGL